MSDRRIDAFFYGLYMDRDVLSGSGIEIVNPRKAYADGYALLIGNRATLVEAIGKRSFGMVMSVTHADINKLYSGLEGYYPEAISVNLMGPDVVPALCYNLAEAPHPDENNSEYAIKLREALARLDFPSDYVASIT